MKTTTTVAEVAEAKQVCIHLQRCPAEKRIRFRTRAVQSIKVLAADAPYAVQSYEAISFLYRGLKAGSVFLVLKND